MPTPLYPHSTLDYLCPVSCFLANRKVIVNRALCLFFDEQHRHRLLYAFVLTYVRVHVCVCARVRAFYAAPSSLLALLMTPRSLVQRVFYCEGQLGLAFPCWGCPQSLILTFSRVASCHPSALSRLSGAVREQPLGLPCILNVCALLPRCS